MARLADPIPITMYVTIILQTYEHILWILTEVPTRRSMSSSVQVWFHLTLYTPVSHANSTCSNILCLCLRRADRAA